MFEVELLSGALLCVSLTCNHQCHVHSQTLRMCRTVAALFKPTNEKALIGCSGGENGLIR